MLSSFGLSHTKLDDEGKANAFYRMPPVSLTQSNNQFIPDYTVLLLCDQIVLDEETFERLNDSNLPSSFRTVAEVTQNLYKEGFIQLQDFSGIVKEKQQLLERMLEQDVKYLDWWLDPYEESVQIWHKFLDRLNDCQIPLYDQATSSQHDQFVTFVHDVRHIASNRIGFSKLLDSIRERKLIDKHGEILQSILSGYLANVNTNLVLSQSLNIGFHDWYDYEPFYRAKLLSIGQEERPEHKRIESIKKLFEISFPEFGFWDSKSLIRALTDNRILELRRLVDEAANGEIEFDQDFARNVIAEISKTEDRLLWLRTITSKKALIAPESLDLESSEKLVNLLCARLNKGELRVLCINLGIRYESLSSFELKGISETKSPDGNTLNISPSTYQRLRTTLLTCNIIDSNRELLSVFVDSRISVWHHQIPQSDNSDSRVRTVIDFLSKQCNSKGENALILFLHVLAEQTNPDNAIHRQLLELVDEIEKYNQIEKRDNPNSDFQSKICQSESFVQVSSSKAMKIKSLVISLAQQGRLHELLETIRHIRPDIDFEDIFSDIANHEWVKFVETQAKKDFQWFYFISDFTPRTTV